MVGTHGKDTCADGVHEVKVDWREGLQVWNLYLYARPVDMDKRHRGENNLVA